MRKKMPEPPADQICAFCEKPGWLDSMGYCERCSLGLLRFLSVVAEQRPHVYDIIRVIRLRGRITGDYHPDA